MTRFSPSQDEALASISLISSQLALPVGVVGVDTLVRRADLAVQNRVQVLGFGEIDLRPEIAWNRDYISGYQWPDQPAFALDFVRADDPCDVKVPWEISRLQMLLWLGQAYRLTSETPYVRHLETVLMSWANSNPVGMGVAWSCPMEAAIRAVNIVYACALTWDELGGSARCRASLTLREHLTYLRRHPELSDVNGNHYLADLMGSVGLGALLTASGMTPAWLRRELDILDAEVARQIGADGVHHEHAVGYHRLVTEMMVHVGVALDHAGLPLPTSFANSLTAMLEFLCAIAGPGDNEVPIVGDSDSGQICIFDCASPNSVSSTVTLAEAVLRGPDGDGPIEGSAGAWILRPRGRAATATSLHTGPSNRIFEPSGFVVLGRGTSRVVSRAGPPGLQGRGAHEHADLTSFTVVLAGLQVVVDPGCSTYTADQVVRRAELSAAGHNLVILDGRDPFGLRPGSVMEVVNPNARGVVDELDTGACRVRMHHNGYVDGAGNPFVHRTLTLSDDGRSLECADEVQGAAPCRATRRILLAPDWCDPTPSRPGAVRFRNVASSEILEVTFSAGSIVVGTGLVAMLYGCRQTTHSIIFDEEIALPSVLTCTFRLLPHQGSDEE